MTFPATQEIAQKLRSRNQRFAPQLKEQVQNSNAQLITQLRSRFLLLNGRRLLMSNFFEDLQSNLVGA